MIRRILFAVFVAWFAIAPAIASSCAAECAKARGDAGLHQLGGHSQAEKQSSLPDCHQPTNDHKQQSGDTDTHKSDAMAAACFVAAAAMHVSLALPITFNLATEHEVLVLLPFVSFEASPPYKPPRA